VSVKIFILQVKMIPCSNPIRCLFESEIELIIDYNVSYKLMKYGVYEIWR